MLPSNPAPQVLTVSLLLLDELTTLFRTRSSFLQFEFPDFDFPDFLRHARAGRDSLAEAQHESRGHAPEAERRQVGEQVAAAVCRLQAAEVPEVAANADVVLQQYPDAAASVERRVVARDVDRAGAVARLLSHQAEAAGGVRKQPPLR